MRELKSVEPTQQSSVFLAYVEEYPVKIPREWSINMFKTVLKYANQSQNKDLQLHAEFRLRRLNSVTAHEESSWMLRFQTLADDYHKKGLYLFEACCYHEMGQLQFQREQYESAFKLSRKTLAILSDIGYDKVPNIIKILHEIALNHYHFKDYDEVIRLMRISLRYPEFSKGLTIQRSNNIAMAYVNTGNVDSANYFFKQAFSYANKYESNIWKGILTANLGEMHYNNEEFHLALSYFKKSAFFNQLDTRKGIVELSSKVNLCKAYLKVDSLQNAENLLLEIRHLLKITQPIYIGDPQQLEGIFHKYYAICVDYYRQMNNYQLVSMFKDSFYLSKTEMEQKFDKNLIKIVTTQLDMKKDQLKVVQLEKKQIQLRNRYLLLLLLFVCLTGSIYFYFYTHKKKRKREAEILKSRNEILALNSEKTRLELDLSREEIRHFTSKVIEQNKLITHFEKNLKLVHLPNAHEKVENLRKLKILTEEDWLYFLKHFTQIYPNLMNVLHRFDPELTESEKRYLMLTRLYLNNKEKAMTLGVSEGAIRITWKRLREKLGIEGKQKPEEIVKMMEARIFKPEYS